MSEDSQARLALSTSHSRECAKITVPVYTFTLEKLEQAAEVRARGSGFHGAALRRRAPAAAHLASLTRW